MIDAKANGVPQEWCRVKISVVTHDNGESWTATTPQFPELKGTGKHPDIAASDLLVCMSTFARCVTSDVQGEIKRAKRAERARRGVR